MSKRFALNIALAVASAFALTLAVPAFACDCDCAKKGAADKKQDPKAPEKKDGEKKAAVDVTPTVLLASADAPKKCDCDKDGKGCTCPKGACKCPNCKHDKLAADAPKAKCECEKGGKGCTCPKGECKCANCGKGDAKKSA